MTSALRTAYRYWTAAVFLAVLVQVGAAGYGAFYADSKADKTNALTHKAFDHGFGLHSALGYVLLIASVLLFVFALGGRLGRRSVLRALALPILVLVAIVLAVAGGKHPVVGIFHPVVAFLVVGLAGFLAHSAWSPRGAASASSTPA
jgi:lipopolysaccharide export LptBFGC system permease protein LptF